MKRSTFATATITGGHGATGTAFIAPTSGERSSYAMGSGDVDGTTTTMVLARSAGDVYRANFVIEVDGEPILIGDRLVTATVDRGVDKVLQTWTVQMSFPDLVAQFGSPWDALGPPLGLRNVNVYGVYLTSTGIHRYPIITNGLCDNMQTTWDPEAGMIAVLNGTCGAGRFDRKLGTLVIPAGAGLTQARAVENLLGTVGIARFRLEDGPTIYKEIQMVDASPLKLCQDILDASARHLFFDREDFAVNPILGSRSGKPIEAFYTFADIVDINTLSITFPGDVPTDITLTGTQQVVKSPLEAAQTVSVPGDVTVSAFYAPIVASFLQGSGGTLTPEAGPGTARFIPIQVIHSSSQTREGVTVAQLEEQYGYHWPEQARYVYASGGTLAFRGGVFLGAGATVSGSEPAYIGLNERWSLLTRKSAQAFYDKTGFTGPSFSGVDEPWGLAFVGGFGNGFKLGTITDTESWYMPRAAVKTLNPGVSWEATDPAPGTLIQGGGDGVVSAEERFILTSREVTVYDADADGFLRSTITYTLSYSRRAGSGFWYNGGTPSSQGQELFQLSGWTVTAYVSTGSATHDEITSQYSFDGQARLVTSTTTQRTGARPDVDRIPASQGTAGLYATPAEAAQQQSASPTEGQPIKIRLTAPNLEMTHEPSIVKTEVPWAENVEQLFAVAANMLLRGCAAQIAFTVLGNFQLAEGKWISLHYPDALLNHQEMEIQSIEHTLSSAKDAPVSNIVANVYPRGDG